MSGAADRMSDCCHSLSVHRDNLPRDRDGLPGRGDCVSARDDELSADGYSVS